MARSRDPHFPPRLSKDLILLFLGHFLWGLGGHHRAVADTGWVIFSISISSTDPGVSPPSISTSSCCIIAWPLARSLSFPTDRTKHLVFEGALHCKQETSNCSTPPSTGCVVWAGSLLSQGAPPDPPLPALSFNPMLGEER